jgi:hypothetical protein
MNHNGLTVDRQPDHEEWAYVYAEDERRKMHVPEFSTSTSLFGLVSWCKILGTRIVDEYRLAF